MPRTLCSTQSRRWVFRILTVVCFAACYENVQAQDVAEGNGDAFFERRIRPLLVEHCLECHGPETQENGLRLDSRTALLQGGKRGAALIPGQPLKSLLLETIRRGGELKMPPSKPLKRQQIADVEKWIRLGAPWPDVRALLNVADDDDARMARIDRLRREHWAFQPIRRPVAPKVERFQDGVRNPIDSFVRARLQSSPLKPSPAAKRGTLIRRLYFDLIGLPPSADEVERFEQDSSPRAFEMVVDRLLDRSEYGERWARHWLDVARYADTTGYAEGAQRRYPFAWTYRDYVVRSLNEDTPFNEFVVEQVAADQLELTADQRWKLAAMGFLTLGPRFNYVRHEIIDDRIDVVTRGLLGLTVTCARCHDHKYDPILTDDYYGLYGVFASSREPLYGDLPAVSEANGRSKRYREYRGKAESETGKFRKFHAETHRKAQHEMRSRVSDYLRYVVQMMPEHRTVNQPTYDTERGRIRGPTPYGPGAIVRWQHYIESSGEEDPVFGVWNQLARLTKESLADSAGMMIKDSETNSTLKAALLEAKPRRMLDVASVYGETLERIYDRWSELCKENPKADRLPDDAAEQLRQVLYADDSPAAMNEDEAHDVYSDPEFNRFMEMKRELDSIFVEYLDVAESRAMILADRMEPEEPRVFHRGVATKPDRHVARRFLRGLSHLDDGKPFRSGSGRLELARRIVHPDNPLTPRVIVNRVWHWHFGRGLVDSPSDFGTRAEPPVHPELLDWLASDFVDHGWSLKHLHRLILTSATWRQRSSESDKAREIDPDNRLLSHFTRRRLGFEALRDSLLAVSGRLRLEAGGPPEEELESPRRSIYLLIDRDDPSDVFATFDSPSPDISIAKRSETTIPQQALFLMNSEFAAEIVDTIVDRLVDEGRLNSVGQVKQLYRQVLSRDPDAQELSLALRFLETSETNADEESENSGIRDLTHALLMSNAFLFVD